MALPLDPIRALADRIAASHSLEIVDLEFTGGAKFRTLRIFLEKTAEARAMMAAEAASDPLHALPAGVPAEMLSGVTHEDCELFARDFGTTLDVEDLIPGAEYTLEVSSPGLERRLSRWQDFERFTGSLVKLQTFTPVGQTRNFQGRLLAAEGDAVTLDLAAMKPTGKARKSARTAAATGQPASTTVVIPFSNIEKANLIAEF